MKIRPLDSVRVRLTLWHVGVLALALVAFSVAVYVLLSRSLHRRVEDDLRSTVAITVNSLTHDTEEGQSRRGAAESTVAELFDPEQTLAIFDESGNLLAENTDEDDFHAALPALDRVPDERPMIYAVPEADDDHLVAVQRVYIRPGNTPYIIFAAQSLETVEEELETFGEILLYAVPMALLLTGLGGWVLARQSLAPVVAMSERARMIGAASLDQQLPVANPRDELGQLAITFNELLARLNAAFAQQRRFMADASHELRTPLSVMHTTAGVTLEQARRDEEEYRDALRIIDEQTRRLSRIVDDMFLLARADAGRYPLRRSKFYLDEMLQETARAAAVLAGDRGVEIGLEAEAEAPFFGDEDLLRQMILNLLDNAIKHTPAGGRVRLRLTRLADAYRVEVEDTGGGIPPEARAMIFERFYRVDPARARAERADGSGAGLGLAISRWIAEQHEGALELARSDRNGSTFAVTLPLPGN